MIFSGTGKTHVRYFIFPQYGPQEDIAQAGLREVRYFCVEHIGMLPLLGPYDLRNKFAEPVITQREATQQVHSRRACKSGQVEPEMIRIHLSIQSQQAAHQTHAAREPEIRSMFSKCGYFFLQDDDAISSF